MTRATDCQASEAPVRRSLELFRAVPWKLGLQKTLEPSRLADDDDQIWLHDLSRDTLTRFTFEGTVNQNPEWTPDGKRIAFRSNREGPQDLFWQLADGSGGLATEHE